MPHRGLKGFAKISQASGLKGFARRRRFITGALHVPDIMVAFNTPLGSVPLPKVVPVTKNGHRVTVPVRWTGTYTPGTAGSYQFVGTLLGNRESNPLNIVSDLTVEVRHEAEGILASATSVYYDFCKLFTSTGALVNGEQGLRDRGGLGLNATTVNGCSRVRLVEGNTILYGVSRTNDDCVSTGSTLLPILTQNRIDIFLSMATTDGQPTGSTTLLGATSTGPSMTFNVFNNSGRINLTYNDGTNNFTFQSNVCLANGQNAGSCFHLKIDFTADTVTLTEDGSNVGGSIISGTVASINPALFNVTNNVYIGATNSNGSVTSITEIVTVFRAAICANITDADATKIVDYFRFYRYPFPSFIVPMMIGDSQSEGAAEAARITAQATYSLTPAEVLIYFKTARSSVDNGTWAGFSGGSNNELVGGTTVSDDVALSTKIQQYTLGNVHMMKTGESGANLDVDWDPTGGTLYDVGTQYYWTVGVGKLLASNPNKRIKTFISIDLITNDISTSDMYQAIQGNITRLIAALRAYDTRWATCPIYWCELNTILSGRQLQANSLIKKFCQKNANMYYISGNPKDSFGGGVNFHYSEFVKKSLSDRVIRKRKIDLTTAEKLGVSPSTGGGDDQHRSYLGMNAKGVLQFNHLKEIGFI
jgi:hypothetical protein